jgi:hypothetical protein
VVQEIEQYQLAWSAQKGPAYRFRLKGLSTWSGWNHVPAAELAAIALILNEKPAYYNSQSHVIFTSEEPTGS